MRIHTDLLTTSDIHSAALIARVDYAEGGFTIHGSRKRARAFNVLLTGESRRRPNGGKRGAIRDDVFAATWDQWGVFLSVLFEADPEMVTPYYKDSDEFHHRTDGRFEMKAGDSPWWPTDAHGDHRFEFAGTPFEQSCTKCSAVQRWGY